MGKFYQYVLAVTLILFLAVSAAADDTAKEQNPAKDTKPGFGESTWISRGKNLGQWWITNSLHHDPLPSQLLYHLEATFSLSQLSGNVETDSTEYTGTLILRKNRFTLTLFGDEKDIDQKISNQELDYHIRDWYTDLRFDILKYLYTKAGVLHQRDDTRNIDELNIHFAGLGTDFSGWHKVKFSFFAAIGNYELEPIPLTNNVAEDTEKYFLQQSFDWSITKTISFHEWLHYLVDVEDGDDYEWDLNLGLQAVIWGPLAVTANYNLKYDNTPLAGITEKQDTALTFGLKVSF